MTASGVLVRPERPEDAAAIRAVHELAFETPTEAAIVDAMRNEPEFLADLSLVAEDQGAIVGHVLVALGRLDPPPAQESEILTLGPIGVVPDRQRQGIGSALMEVAIDAADARGSAAIVLVGHPWYYPRFGFERARPHGLEPPGSWPDDPWMVRRLSAWRPLARPVVVRFGRPFPTD